MAWGKVGVRETGTGEGRLPWGSDFSTACSFVRGQAWGALRRKRGFSEGWGRLAQGPCEAHTFDFAGIYPFSSFLRTILLKKLILPIRLHKTSIFLPLFIWWLNNVYRGRLLLGFRDIVILHCAQGQVHPGLRRNWVKSPKLAGKRQNTFPISAFCLFFSLHEASYHFCRPALRSSEHVINCDHRKA